MTTLLLIRHAATAETGVRLGGRTQASLTETGRGQADAAAERLRELPVKAVYASPLPRAWETAEAIAAHHRLQVREAEGLLEVEYGRWTGRSLKQVARTKLWQVIQARPSRVRFPEGETIREAQLRAVEAVESLVVAHRRNVVAAVSHADVIKAVVAFYLGMPLDLFQRIHIGPASLTGIQLGPDSGPVLWRFNDDGPLRAEQFRQSRGRAASSSGSGRRSRSRSAGSCRGGEKGSNSG
jgi:probable phosphoglycerate mutase